MGSICVFGIYTKFLQLLNGLYRAIFNELLRLWLVANDNDEDVGGDENTWNQGGLTHHQFYHESRRWIGGI